ncbi:hypothetical protein LTR53_011487 [Teratosphaeriaceae sp. CCFEE 6253]|nr:hypothetical protein LTR53_011487 [Teratosphaeriaceae sp. CCFEE 6253]
MENSPLGKLPAELRNRIYKHALQVQGGVIVDAGPQSHVRGGLPALPWLCRQLKNETFKMMWSVNDFIIRVTANNLPGRMGHFDNTRVVIDVARCLAAMGHHNVKRAASLTLDLGVCHVHCSKTRFKEIWKALTEERKGLVMPLRMWPINVDVVAEVYDMGSDEMVDRVIRYSFPYGRNRRVCEDRLEAGFENALKDVVESEYEDVRDGISRVHESVCHAVLLAIKW